MKFMLRIFGTWFLGLALVLIVVDGVKTLATQAVTVTSLAEMWGGLHATSWTAVSEAVVAFFTTLSAQQVALNVFGWPGWVIFGCAGLVFLLLGRQSAKKRYIETY